MECSLCGLIYVGETKGQLRNRMSGHRYEINHGSNQLLYQHFNLPDHSILSFKMRTEQIMCLNRGRSKGEDRGHVKSI